MGRLSKEEKLKLLRVMVLSRLGDLREQSLIRQGKGWFHVSGMGHEALSVVGQLMRSGDYFAGYYRDRPIALGRGVSNYELALSFFAKRSGASAGRQMPAHYSSVDLGIFSVASVVGASLLPACGFAWGVQLDGKKNVVITTVGDAGTRQGDFYECVAFAKERNLPLIVLVEDNGIGISSVTEDINPLALEVFNPEQWQRVDGCDVEAVHQAVSSAMKSIREGGGPCFLWCKTERISSHSSADDHRKYRSAEELEGLEEKDPINRLKRRMIEAGELTEQEYQKLYQEVESEVRADFERASQELDPDPARLMDHVYGKPSNSPRLVLPLEEKTRMVDSVNATFHAALKYSDDFVFFGQDIEDPKGGVFSLTKGLSTQAPERVANSPLAESTIFGVAVGLAAYGKRPVFEIQFTDYIWAGFNQLVTHLATLHWRTNGEWKAPAVIYAPYGAYLPGGALWHSQANEGALAHFPGVQIAIPSTPEDAAGLFWTAMHGNSPTLVLIPKHLMWHPRELEGDIRPVPFGKARVVAEGSEISIVTWGNCTEVVQNAVEDLGMEPGVIEWIDLRTVAPLDIDTVKASVARTGRLLVVQEDAESCSIGQKIITQISSDSELFNRLLAAPVLLAKPDVNIGYNPVLEYAALPDRREVAHEVRSLLSTRIERSGRRESVVMAQPNQAVQMLKETFSSDLKTPDENIEINVPILGEGITSARVISLLVKPGEDIEQDDPLCEVETDKALFPIESAHDGVFEKWFIKEGDEVDVGQLIALLRAPASSENEPRTSRPVEDPAALSISPPPVMARPTEGGLSPHIVAQMRNVVPAHMTVKAGFAALREARQVAKESMGKDAPSPTVMIAWAMVQAMKRHPIFACTVTAEDTLVQHSHFDFGVAVSLDNDALDTAVIPRASALDWSGFLDQYKQAVTRVRSGQSVSKAGTPLILTSMGGFKVRDALPVVVPPAIGTLFVGEAHYDDTPAQDAREVVSLCLSFDHRWLNGVAGAQFLSDVVEEMEKFSIPVNS